MTEKRVRIRHLAGTALLCLIPSACVSLDRSDLNVLHEGFLAQAEVRPLTVVLLGENPTQTQAFVPVVESLGWTLLRRVHASDIDLAGDVRAPRGRPRQQSASTLYDFDNSHVWNESVVALLDAKALGGADLVLTVQTQQGQVAVKWAGLRLDAALIDCAGPVRAAHYYGVVKQSGPNRLYPLDDATAVPLLASDFLRRMSPVMQSKSTGGD